MVVDFVEKQRSQRYDGEEGETTRAIFTNAPFYHILLLSGIARYIFSLYNDLSYRSL